MEEQKQPNEPDKNDSGDEIIKPRQIKQDPPLEEEKKEESKLSKFKNKGNNKEMVAQAAMEAGVIS